MFQIQQRGSTVGREVLGGVTTFMAMSYIIFVQPVMLKATGMDEGGVFMATCISSALACVLMGLMANYPIALAPGMGMNAFFVFTLCGIFGLAWTEALALTAIAGVIFLLLSVVGFRSHVLNAIPDALKSGIAAGIGLFIALIGFEWGNVVTSHPATFITLAKMPGNYVAGLTLLGLAVTMALMALRVRGALLLGILVTTLATWAVGAIFHVPSVTWGGLVSMPEGLTKTAGGFAGGFGDLWARFVSGEWIHILSLLFILLFMDLFDTVGTLVGVASRARLMVDGRLPRAEQALAADAAGTVLGATLGTSTVTSYIESVTGVSAGARTGLAAIVTGACMLTALLFQPLVRMVGGGVTLDGSQATYYPMIAPALIVVGALMLRVIRDIKWDDITEALPAFLAMVVMPFAFSISAGIAIGFVSYAFGKLVTGRAKECPIVVYVFAALFVAQYAFLAR